MNKYAWTLAVFGLVAAGTAGYLVARSGTVGSAMAGVPTATEGQLGARTFGGPLVSGLCVLSQSAVYAHSRIGEAATARYRALTTELRTRLAPEQQSIQDAAKKLPDERSSMSPAEFQKAEEALAQRARALQIEAGLNSRALEATRLKALKQIAALENPIIAEAYRDHHCGVLFSRDMMLAGNPDMDLTADVVQGLDAKQTTIAFDLEHLSPPAAQ